METLEYDYNVFGSQQAEADKNLAVRFFTMPLRDDVASTKQGRPIYVDTPMIEIRVRGDRNNIVQRPVREDDRRRFGRIWDAFERGLEVKEAGTPLSEWPSMSASMVEELKYLGFNTVEQLAEANDAACSKVNGLMSFRNKAKLFLELAKDNAPLETLSKQNEELKSQLEVAQRTLTDTTKRLDALTDKFNALTEKVATKK